MIGWLSSGSGRFRADVGGRKNVRGIEQRKSWYCALDLWKIDQDLQRMLAIESI